MEQKASSLVRLMVLAQFSVVRTATTHASTSLAIITGRALNINSGLKLITSEQSPYIPNTATIHRIQLDRRLLRTLSLVPRFDAR